MLWDPGSVNKDGEEEKRDIVSVTPILVPLQNEPAQGNKGVPVLVPDVQDLKDQFQQQQNMLTQIKETLQQNKSQMSSKGKQVEVYANKLSQIRARSKNTQGKKPGTGQAVVNPTSSPKTITKKSSKENLTKIDNIEDKPPSDNNSKIGRKGKVLELKKCLEENKIKFEQRTGKEQSETKKIESIVEQLKMQLEERDKTIQDLQKNIEQPTLKLDASLPRKTKQKSDKESVASKTTQTNRTQPSEDSIEIIALQNKIYELEANILDLEENLKEKESVIEARTQAVTLLSQDLSLKGKNTLENLEETRQEMRVMQNNFIAVEDKLRKELLDRENRLTVLEDKCKKLESTNFELSVKNAEQQEKLVNLQQKYLEADAERKSLKESIGRGQSEAESDELTKKINHLTKELDDRNKSMIKMKIEHKKQLKSINETLESLKKTSDDKAEILRLRNLLEEFENVKTGLENRVAELEDEKATEKKLKDQINELEIMIKKQNEDLTLHMKTISKLEEENLNLIQSNKERVALIDDLEAKIRLSEKDGNAAELRRKLENAEAEHKRKLEEMKGEHKREMETLISYCSAKGESIDRKELEEFRISTEISNIHVEEQIELLIQEKQQLLEKLKSLSGVSSTDSLTFEKMEHSDLRDDKEATPHLPEEDVNEESRLSHLQRIVNDQQTLISDLQKTIDEEKHHSSTYQKRIGELEETIKRLEEVKQQMEMSEWPEAEKSQKSNVNAKNRLKKVEMELSRAKKTVQEQSEKLKDLNSKLEEKDELIKKYTEKIETFEKDDWDRQNHWKNSEDDLESFQELQKKCLSLENNLIELSEDCERLRKENIEVVHLLSEEKVKRRQLLEQLESRSGSDFQENLRMVEAVKELERKVEKLESMHSDQEDGKPEIAELQEKLEWANVVLTSKETEIFRLQSLLEDRSKAVEILEGDLVDFRAKLAEREKKLSEVIEELKGKEVQLGEISINFDKLQECVDVANQKTATNETQLKELLATVKEMEGDVFKKESELQEIKGILAEKNLDMTNLRNRLEEVNSDLTYSYQEHLENMGKCLRDKESDYDALLAEKTHLEEVNRNLVTEKEDIYNQKVEMSKEKDKLRSELSEKEKQIAELMEKLKIVEKSQEAAGGKDKTQEMEDLKIKMKKLAANLKKKAQNEADLLKQVKELESSLAEKQKIADELKGVTEKWTVEKNEKEQIAKDLQQVLLDKAELEKEKADLKEKILNLERNLEDLRRNHETQMGKLGEEMQWLRTKEQEDKGKLVHLEGKLAEMSQLCQNADSAALGNRREIEEERKAKESLLSQLAEMTGKYEKAKFERHQLELQISDLEKKIEEVEKSAVERSRLDAKIQENLTVIESLQEELKKTQDQMKVIEEKFFHSEERRLSLESKNEEMCKKIMEDSETLVTIDDLWIRVDELLKSEKLLQDSVKNLEAGNFELKQALDQVQTEKFNLETELKSSSEKISELGGELKFLKDSDSEKSTLIIDLTKQVEKLKSDNRQMSLELEKVNRDYKQYENELSEIMETSQKTEKGLKRRIEELSNENVALVEKCKEMSQKAREEEEVKQPKRRKSVTFQTEVEYIKDSKDQSHYEASLEQAYQEIENLKAELLREKLRNEVLNVVAEAEEKVESLRSTPEKKKLPMEPEIVKTMIPLAEVKPGQERKFDANVFFGNEGGFESATFFDQAANVRPEEGQPTSDFDSLVWDDGWGADGHLEEEYLAGRGAEPASIAGSHDERIKLLEEEVEKLREENEKLAKELQEQSAKYAKAIKKVKEFKAGYDKLQSEVSKMKNSSSFGNLDAAIADELKSQIEAMEVKEKELMKSLENARVEKESLLKRIDVLNAGNEKFLEMKERQDNEAEIWQRKNNELIKEISVLRQKLENQSIPDDNQLMKENRELKNQVEALEWSISELNELLEEKQEMLEGRPEISDNVVKVMEEKSLLQKEVDELNNVKKRLEQRLFDEEKKNSVAIGELNERLTRATSENETLQNILKEKSEAGGEKPESKIFDYFKSVPAANDLFVVMEKTAPPKHAKASEVKKAPENLVEERKQQQDDLSRRIAEVEGLVRQKEEELKTREEEVESVRLKLAEVENAMKMKEKELRQLQSAYQNKETEANQRFLVLEAENEKKIAVLQQSVGELENLLWAKEEELQQLRSDTNALQQRNEIASNPPNCSETVRTFKPEDVEMLRQRIFQLEELVTAKEGELQKIIQTKDGEMEGLRGRIFQLEDLLRTSQEELSRLQSNWTEVDTLRQKIRDLEEFSRLKENEKRILEEKIFELENSTRGGAEQSEELQRRIFELENLLTFKEEEFHRVLMEVEGLRQRVIELENLLPRKDEELNQLVMRLKELEKNYNDSKMEIERLLNEEKLNSEEKFVEPFQKNIQIPVAFELEALSRTLTEEKQKSENLKYELTEKENHLRRKEEEIESLNAKLVDVTRKEQESGRMMQREFQPNAEMEKMIVELQKELETANLQLEVTRGELEEFQKFKDGVVSGLESKLFELEARLVESRERSESELSEMRRELSEKVNSYEALLESKRKEETRAMEKIKELEASKASLEKEVAILKSVLEGKENDIETLAQMVEEEKSRVAEASQLLTLRQDEVNDLKQTLTHLQGEISQFRNFEKQVKELRVTALKEAGSDVAVTSEGRPDLSDWTEHELAELSTRLQSDLDTALYMLHQRDVRCDELTFELMQLLEERDTLQLRLSTALRMNEDLKFGKADNPSSSHTLQENKDLVDQSNDRQGEKRRGTSEDLRQLANKISELHSVSYLRDKTVKDDSLQRHNEQMNLLSRISESDMSLSRDVQSSPAVLLNWVRGKTTPKVMHL